MLDNFGFGEFFALALLAFLFFGPEQLPRIGARVGRWVRSMTRYSRAFLDEWQEEALAVHDAVAEVKGIRDEIAAARAEIASTMNTARTDLSEAVEGAKLDVRSQVRDGTQIRIAPANETSGVTGLGRAAGSATSGGAEAGPSAAIAKTQQIADALPASRDGQAGADRAAAHQRERVTDGDLHRLRGDVDELSAHLSALRRQLAQVRAALENAPGPGPADAHPVGDTGAVS